MCGSTAKTAAAQTKGSAVEVNSSKEELLHRKMLELRNLERSGDRAGAIRLGEQLQGEFPAEPRVENALLNLYRAERRVDKLLGLLQARLDRNPDDIAAMRELGAHLISLKRQDEAMAVVQTTIRANPMDELRYRTAAVLFRSPRELDVAVDLYRQGRATIRQEGLFAAELAQLEESRGNYEAAIGEYILLVLDPERRSRAQRKIERLLERAEDKAPIVAQIDELRLRKPQDPAVQDIAATVYLQSGRHEDAMRAIQVADRYAQDDGQHLLEFGRAALQADENEAADLDRVRAGVSALERLPKAHPRSPLIPESSRLMAGGLVLVARQVEEGDDRNKLLEKAVESLDASIEQDEFPELQRDALAMRAMILFEELGRKKEALATLEVLVDRQRREGESHHMVQVQMGLVLAAMDSLTDARRVLQEIANTQVLELPEGSAPGQRRNVPETIARARALYHLADLDLIDEEFEMALTGFADLAEEAPEDRMANDCLDLALLLNEATFYDGPESLKVYARYRLALMRREPQTARACLEQIVEKHGESTLHPIALFELATSYQDERKYDLALQRFANVVEQHAEHRLAPRALEAIGDIWLSHLGQPQTAQEQYERILLEYPDDLFVDGVRRKLLAARQATQEEPHATP
jgi:tetratricopeptide (TPR) repeat protein